MQFFHHSQPNPTGSKLAALGLLCLLASAQAAAQELKTEDLYKKVIPSVMTLLVDKKDGSKSLGTAFLAVKDGLAVTAWHVVRDATKVEGRFSSGEVFESSGLIDKDEKRDIALIRIKVFGRPTLEIKGVDPEIGSKAFVVGAPEGLEFSITDGVVSQVQTLDGIRYYQYSCPTSHGNSGGPVLSATGSVIGVVSWGLKNGQNLNFAIPGAYVLGLDTSLSTTEWSAVKSTEPAKAAPTLSEGVVTKLSNADLDKEMYDAKESIINGRSAVDFTYDRIVTRKNGYKDGVPTELYARQKTLLNFKTLLMTHRSDDPVRDAYRVTAQAQVTILSYGIRQLMDAIKLSQMDEGWTDRASDVLRQSQATIRGLLTEKFADSEVSFFGISEVKDACPERLRRYLGFTKDDTGFKLGVIGFTDYDDRNLMVVEKDTLAAKMGLRSLDYLKDFDGKPVTSLMDFKKNLKNYTGKKVKATVKRDGKEREIELRIPQDLNKP